MGSGVASLRDPELPPATDTDDDEHSTTSGGRDAVVKTVVKRGFKKDKVRKEVWHDNEPAGQPVQSVVSPMKNCRLHFFHWFEALAIMSCLGVLTHATHPTCHCALEGARISTNCFEDIRVLVFRRLYSC
jgi:hypothetical protein